MMGPPDIFSRIGGVVATSHYAGAGSATSVKRGE